MLSWHFGGHLVHQFIEMFKFNSLLKCLYTIKLSITYLFKCCNKSLIAQFIADFIVLISNNYHISKYEFLTRSKRFSPRIGNFDQTWYYLSLNVSINKNLISTSFPKEATYLLHSRGVIKTKIVKRSHAINEYRASPS